MLISKSFRQLVWVGFAGNVGVLRHVQSYRLLRQSHGGEPTLLGT